jgi:pyrimidine oxygenase
MNLRWLWLINFPVDEEAVSWLRDQGGKDTKAAASATVVRHKGEAGAVNFNAGTLIGSFESVAKMLDEIASESIKGIMMTFDDFEAGVENFGTKIQPLMKSRAEAHAALK